MARKKDLYVDATLICKAGGKELANYLNNKSTSEFLTAMSTVLGIPRTNLVEINRNKGTKHTWVHRRVAYHLAMWCSPVFACQVTEWLDQLLAFGRVNLDAPKPPEKEIVDALHVKIKELETMLATESQNRAKIELSFNSLEKKHHSLLLRRNYHKLKRGPCFYIVTDGWRKNEYFKYGKTTDINFRLADYRTGMPRTTIRALCYTEHCSALEIAFELHFKDKKSMQNHEYLEGMKFETLLSVLKTVVKFFKIEATFETEEELEKYNSQVIQSEDDDEATLELESLT